MFNKDKYFSAYLVSICVLAVGCGIGSSQSQAMEEKSMATLHENSKTLSSLLDEISIKMQEAKESGNDELVPLCNAELEKIAPSLIQIYAQANKIQEDLEKRWQTNFAPLKKDNLQKEPNADGEGKKSLNPEASLSLLPATDHSNLDK